MLFQSQWNETTSFNGDFQRFATTLPLLNRLLVPVMVPDQLPSNDDTPPEPILRFPGTLVTNAAGEPTVLIPLVEYEYQGIIGGYHCAGETIVKWVTPVEEIRVDHDREPTTPIRGPYALLDQSDTSNWLPSFEPGMVALRINYPAQSTSLANRIDRPPVDNLRGLRGGVLVIADDTALVAGETGCYRLILDRDSATNAQSDPQGGRYGLGSLPFLGKQVRVYRKVMTFQAIYRREVFDMGSTP